MIIKNFYLCCFLAMLLQGCETFISAPLAPSEDDQQALLFAPRPGLANIYVYRAGTNTNYDYCVTVNRRVAGKTSRNTYFRFSVDPGKYLIQSNNSDEDAVTIQAEAGKNYYIYQETFLFASRITRLQQVDEKTGRSKILSCCHLLQSRLYHD